MRGAHYRAPCVVLPWKETLRRSYVVHTRQHDSIGGKVSEYTALRIPPDIGPITKPRPAAPPSRDIILYLSSLVEQSLMRALLTHMVCLSSPIGNRLMNSSAME